ncbi:hypothetical protein AB0G35_31225 [Streptomyces sp. NPDC021749]|uniref:hypothetical protein n=1 Tax=Streptomyces sp. NPDC021749 TaxID=3154905 RepID=UPI0033ED668C
MPTGSPVRETVRAYADARFRGDITAAALTGDGFVFRSPFITSGSRHGHLDGLEVCTDPARRHADLGRHMANDASPQRAPLSPGGHA